MKTDPESQEFPRAARLLSGSDYNWVFAKPKRSRDALFTVLSRWRGDETTRLGLAVSRKTARRAVDRNRIKRLVREGFRQRRYLFLGLDIVVVARPGIAKCGNVELQRSLATHWLRLEKLKPRQKG